MARTTQLTLGELIQALKRQEEHRTVKFDFCYFVPTGVHSYRGYYEQLAVNYEDAEAHKVEDFLKVLEDALGEDFCGYKGGVYKMKESTPVWVDKPNHSSGTAIVGVRDNGYQVILETANID